MTDPSLHSSFRTGRNTDIAPRSSPTSSATVSTWSRANQQQEQHQNYTLYQKQPLANKPSDATEVDGSHQRTKHVPASQQHSEPLDDDWRKDSGVENIPGIDLPLDNHCHDERLSDALDLHDTSLEDLEGLIAASAQRLASYRVKDCLENRCSPDCISISEDSIDMLFASDGVRQSYDSWTTANMEPQAVMDQPNAVTLSWNKDLASSSSSLKSTRESSSTHRHYSSNSSSNRTSKLDIPQQLDPLLSPSADQDSSYPLSHPLVRKLSTLSTRRSTKDKTGVQSNITSLDMNTKVDENRSSLHSAKTLNKLAVTKNGHSTITQAKTATDRLETGKRVQQPSLVGATGSRLESDTLSNKAKDSKDSKLLSKAADTRRTHRSSLSASLSHVGSQRGLQEKTRPELLKRPMPRTSQAQPKVSVTPKRDIGTRPAERPARLRTTSGISSTLTVKPKSKLTSTDHRDATHASDITAETNGEQAASLGGVVAPMPLKKKPAPLKTRFALTVDHADQSSRTHTSDTPLKATQSSNVMLNTHNATAASSVQRSKSTCAALQARSNRGKTLSGNQTSSQSMASLTLPPRIKLESLQLSAQQDDKSTSQSPAKTSKRIPNAMAAITTKGQQSQSASPTGSSDEHVSISSAEHKRTSLSDKTKQVRQAAHTAGHASIKIGSTTTVYSGTKSISTNARQPRTEYAFDRPTVSSSARTVSTKTVQRVKATEMTSRQRKISTLGSSTKMSLSESTRGNKLGKQHVDEKDNIHAVSQRKPTTLRTRLHSLTDKESVPASNATNGEATAQEVLVGQENTVKSKQHSAERDGTKDDQRNTSTHTDNEKASPNATTTTTNNHLVREKPKTLRDKEASIRIVMSPQAALILYNPFLSPFEKNEIIDYPSVHFVGHHAKKHPATPDAPDNNYGYDDEHGDYKVVMCDHLAYRYEVLQILGKGSFGQVLKCLDHKAGEMVAVKIIRNKKRFHAQALVEVNTLQNLIEWDPDDKHNNVRMTSHFYFRKHLCIVFECLSINLYDFIKNNHFQGFSMALIRRFATQLLNSLLLLSKHKLIHCDLKPENILLTHPSKSSIKVIDFGSSCLENQKVYTYIQSRFYRSPEVILGLDYGVAIDMWSVGCILAELHAGYPLFPGENEQDQLACIMEIQGLPDKRLIEKSSRRRLFFDVSGMPCIPPNSKGRKRRPGTKTLAKALRTTDEYFISFIDACLQWDPKRRLTPQSAMKHPWIMNPSSSTKRQQR